MTIGDNDEYVVEPPSVTGRTKNWEEIYKNKTIYHDIFKTYKRAWDFYSANKAQ